MARQLKEFPKTFRNNVYPWDDWLIDGAVWELQQGVDFHCGLNSIQSAIKQQARKRGLLARSISNKKKQTIIFMCWAPTKQEIIDYNE